jgi:ATP-dependent protease HslVU (ClpYQ) peptidase subunit
MTCIVGLVHEGKIWMGGDSAATAPWSLRTNAIADSKVFANGPFLFGVCGSPRAMQLLKHSFRAPDHDPRTEAEKYLATSFVNAVRDCFKDGGFAEKNKEAEGFYGEILVGYKGELFVLGGDYEINRSANPYAAIGSGMDVALGSMYSTEDMHPKARITIALEAAEEFNAGVRAPFVIKELGND